MKNRFLRVIAFLAIIGKSYGSANAQIVHYSTLDLDGKPAEAYLKINMPNEAAYYSSNSSISVDTGFIKDIIPLNASNMLNVISKDSNCSYGVVLGLNEITKEVTLYVGWYSFLILNLTPYLKGAETFVGANLNFKNLVLELTLDSDTGWIPTGIPQKTFTYDIDNYINIASRLNEKRENKIPLKKAILYPNPTGDITTVSWPTAIRETGSLRVVDISGKTVETIGLAKGVTSTTLSTINFKAGSYLIIIEGAGSVYNATLQVSH